ncbi:RQC trigger complex subunit Cue3p [[Candida] railenensis]|uniref:RQC trigger complex subunit Cue3p n=1 Tax=[Candida] railenensis TaxID=45579 RepID=A0A9P0QJU0_9ASCO|nr:RQC trigger complex subunit Cue3p [[Candida] railenensis]
MEEEINIPINISIPHYPPFKLRSSLIDKDPVIWVHLLEAYIRLFKFLLSKDEDATKILSIKSQQQLQLFLKVFLYETAHEATQIFSLGAINPDIKENTYQLKVFVFQFLRNYSLVKLQLTGEAIWHFISIYVFSNPIFVRGLVDGSYKSKFNDNKKSGSISCISLLQKYLQDSILNGNFTNADLSTLSFLLGQHGSGTSKTFSLSGPGTTSTVVNKKGSNSLSFAEEFANPKWIEILEKSYANGMAVGSETSKKLMITSLVSLSVAKIAKLALELGIKNSKTLIISPLFSSIIISEPFKELVPGLEERSQFLRKIRLKTYDDTEVNLIENNLPSDDQILFLQEIFPTLTKSKATTILLENNGNVETVTSILLENPNLVETIEEYKAPQASRSGKKEKAKISQSLIDRFSNVGFEKDAIMSRQRKDKSVDLTEAQAKEKTLTNVLRMMYDSDEDEPDDTYDDSLATVGTAATSDESKSSSKRGGASSNRLAVYVDDNDEEKLDGVDGLGNSIISKVNPATSPPPTISRISQQERILFAEYKVCGAPLFAKEARNEESKMSSSRNIVKRETGWSDEKIENWFKMVSRSPNTFKALEEDYYYNGNPNKRNNIPITANSVKKKFTPKPKVPVKNARAKNEKNKASKANHNRKSGHNSKTRNELAGMQ